MLLFVRLLVLIACGPLLVPAGFCVCHADEPHHAAETDAPPHDDHDSDCPASMQLDASQPTPTLLILDAGPTPEPLAFASHVPTPTRSSRADSIDRTFRLPLYVSHCALVL